MEPKLEPNSSRVRDDKTGCSAPLAEPCVSSSGAMQRRPEGRRSRCVLPVHEENNGHREMSHFFLVLFKLSENPVRNQYIG